MFNNCKYILFDLDGTLTDSGCGIINSIKYALNHFNVEIQSDDQLRKFVGPPLKESYMKFCGFTQEQAVEGLKVFREYFEKQGMFENEVYENIELVLKKLQDSGKILVVATSKPEIYSVKILKHFNMDKYFSIIAGSDFEETRVKKGDVIKYALNQLKEKYNDFSKEQCVMIGDREHDILGAKENNLKSIGVLYGYGDVVELTQCRADRIVKKPEELLDVLL